MNEYKMGRCKTHVLAFVAALFSVILMSILLPRYDTPEAPSANYIGNLGATYEAQQVNWRNFGQALATGERWIVLGSSELTSSDLRFISYKFLSEELSQPVLAYGHAHFQSQGMYFLLASHAQRLSPQSRVVILLSPGWFDTRGLSRGAFKEHVLPLLPRLIESPEARKELAAWARRRGNGEIVRATINEWAFDLRSRVESQGRQLFTAAQLPPAHPAISLARARPTADWLALKQQAIALEQEHMSSNPYGVRQDYLDKYLTDLTPDRKNAFPTNFDSLIELDNLERLMTLLSDRGVQALFILQPLNPLVFRDLDRFQAVQERIRDLCGTHNMHCLDMYNTQPYQVGTLRDGQHLGEVGWLDVSRKMMEVFAP